MPLLSESADILPIHRRTLAFSFIGWISDFYDLLLLTFVVSSTSLVKDLALSRDEVAVLLGFKTIWLPTYFHEIRGLSLGDSAWLLFMDQVGSVIGFGYGATTSAGVQVSPRSRCSKPSG
ncbi:MAG: hypothetical protein LAO77_14810 [Acidobacteriia bacterium]|nr:hypothetical protein [Terriglobia bacterium]